MVLGDGHIHGVMRTEDARHVPQDVKSTEFCDAGVHDRPTGLRVSHIGLQDHKAVTDQRPGGPQPIGVDVDTQDAAAFRDHTCRHRPTDPGTGPGDDATLPSNLSTEAPRVDWCQLNLLQLSCTTARPRKWRHTQVVGTAWPDCW